MIGRSARRLEDPRLLRGEGRYTDDVRAEGEVAMVFVRSEHPAGRIAAIDTTRALAMPGVLGIVTAADLAAEGIGHFKPRATPPTADSAPVHVPPFPALADGAVRHVGDPILAVVAETLSQARDAAEAVAVDIEEAPFVTDPLRAREGEAVVWPSAPDNRVYLAEFGDAAAVDAAMAGARHRISRRLAISRVTAVTLEPRAVLAMTDPETGAFTLRLGTQAPHGIAAATSALMGLEPGRLRVISEQCGGSFGMRNPPAAEYVVALSAARRFGRPVRWTETRSEAFLADPQAREQIVDATLALDAEGRFLAFRAAITAPIGAYVGPTSLHSSFGNIGSLAGVYATPAIHARIEALHVNTQTMSAYRGAGRPEATFMIERMIDIAAREIGIDRAELRRRNMIRPAQMPYRTPLTFTYDSGDFPAVLDHALRSADWAGFEGRRAEAAARGRLRGIGIACPIEIAGGPATGPAPEYARLELAPEGFTLRLGTGDSGQGHAVTFLQVVQDALGLPPEAVRFVAGDTGAVTKGTGTFGSRSVASAGTALNATARALRERLRAEAAEHLEAAADDVIYEDGAFRIAGTDRAVGTAELVAERGLTIAEERFVSADAATFPNGCHIVEVEIDPETGAMRVERYLVVDDVGTVINPMLVAGQICGGVVQGVGQAMMERIVHDPDSGQVLTASFMDYAMPRASDVPGVAVETHAVPTPSNPLGAKGAGEAGTVGALPALISAVCDALAPLGIDHIDMPATSERIWRAIREAEARRGLAVA